MLRIFQEKLTKKRFSADYAVYSMRCDVMPEHPSIFLIPSHQVSQNSQKRAIVGYVDHSLTWYFDALLLRISLSKFAQIAASWWWPGSQTRPPGEELRILGGQQTGD